MSSSPRIVSLDGHTLNPGDLNAAPFERLGDYTEYPCSTPEEVLERGKDVPYLIVNKVEITGEVIAALPAVQYIGVTATGYNIVDLKAASGRNIVVTNVPTYGTDTVAQHTFALILELSRHTSLHHAAVQDGAWSRSDDFCFALAPIRELTGLTLGILGLGRIGRGVAKIGAAMGMRLVGHDLYWPTDEQLDGLEIESREIDEVFQQADVLTMHCPLTAETHHLVNKTRLSLMKSDAVLVNTSRGPLIDNEALADALRNDVIAGAGVDVLDVEPPPADHPLIAAPRCVVTPHIAWYARAARQRLLDTAASNLSAYLDGKVVNQVN